MPEKRFPNRAAKYLGFDFGTRWIGVAVGQMITATASPETTLEVTKDRIPWDPIEELIDNWQPAALIVGIPLNMDGSKQEMTEKAEKFRQELEQRFGLPVHGMDERLSSVEARERIFERQGYKGLKKQKIDSETARLILESWLAQQTTS